MTVREETSQKERTKFCSPKPSFSRKLDLRIIDQVYLNLVNSKREKNNSSKVVPRAKISERLGIKNFFARRLILEEIQFKDLLITIVY